MKNKKIKIISIVVIILIAVALLGYYYSFVVPNKDIAQKCQGFVPNWADFVDCNGVVSINDGWDMDYLSLKDHVHEYEIARVYNQNQYLYADGKVFVINRKNIENSASDNVKTTYHKKLFQNGKLVENAYSSISDIPTYLVIDYKSGEVNAYKSINEVPENSKVYFTEIKNK